VTSDSPRAAGKVSRSTRAQAGQPAVEDLPSALAALDSAIDLLAAAIDGRMEYEAGLADAEAEVQRMGADRTRLAEALDGAEARSKRLENTNREVSHRLVGAMEAIRIVLDRQPQ
jgi:hypothetical protein